MLNTRLPILVLLIPLALFQSRFSHAQMGIGTLNPDPRSVLDLKSTPGKGRGLLIPRMTTLTRRGMELGAGAPGADSVGLALASQHNSLVLFDNTQNLYYGYNNTMPVVRTPGDYDAIGTIAEDARVWQIINPWKTQYAWNGSKQLVNLIQDTAATGYVGIGWVDYTESPTFPLHVKGDGYFESSNLKVDQNITARSVNADTLGADTTFIFGYGSVPVGTVLMWTGVWDENVETVMKNKGWLLCDDKNANDEMITYTDVLGVDRRVPDLSGRFIVGFDTRDDDYDTIGNIGPNYFNYENQDSDKFYEIINEGKYIKMKLKGMPKHKHKGETSTDGRHNHSGDPNKSGTVVDIDDWGLIRRSGGGFTVGDIDASPGEPNVVTPPRYLRYDGNHNHKFTTEDTGSYKNSLNQQQDDGAPQENRPPYYVLAFIVRVK